MRSTGHALCAAILSAVVVLLPQTSFADTILVDHAGGGDYTAIQPALDAAADGDSVLIAPGTYTGPQNRALTFGPGKNLVIEAQSGLPTVTIDCQGQDRAFYLHTTGQDTTTVIRGIWFRNGYTDNYDGGAIIARYATFVLEDCLFQDCVASHNGGAVSVGYTETRPAVRIRNCVFKNNSATYRAGALLVDHGSAAIRSCLFTGNSTNLATHDSNGGGAIFLNQIDDTGTWRVDMTRCTIVGNYSVGAGSGIRAWNSSVWSFIDRCIVAFNGGPGLGIDGDPPIDAVTFSCAYGNQGGNISSGYSTVLEDDPYFCDFYSDDFTLCQDSCALPDNNVWTVLMGFADEGCSAPCSSPVEQTSWGRIKALYAPRNEQAGRAP